MESETQNSINSLRKRHSSLSSWLKLDETSLVLNNLRQQVADKTTELLNMEVSSQDHLLRVANLAAEARGVAQMERLCHNLLGELADEIANLESNAQNT